MAKPAGEREQWETRTSVTMTDQHGREYSCEMDKETMNPVGIPTPRNFRQPVPTPSKYLNPVKGRLGQLFVNYTEWKRDILAAEQARTIRLRQLAEKTYGNAAPKMLEDPPGDLLYKLGHGPIPIEFVMAMEAGKSPWALGLRRPDGRYYPKPKWVTEDLEKRKDLALSQAWSGEGMGGDLPMAAPGQFEDEPVEYDDIPFALADEDEIVDELPAEAMVGAGYGSIGSQQVIAVADAPAKRGRGRPRKN